jgi:RNase H-fold protein (predicted Holliday junction resolvase)
MFGKTKELERRIKELEETVSTLKKNIRVETESGKILSFPVFTFWGDASPSASIGKIVKLLLEHLHLEVNHVDEKFTLQTVKRSNNRVERAVSKQASTASKHGSKSKKNSPA